MKYIFAIILTLAVCASGYAAQLKDTYINGSLGVGTSTPATALHVIGTVTVSSLGAHESGTITMNGNIKLNGKYLSGDGGNEGIYVGNSGQVLVGGHTSVSPDPGVLMEIRSPGGTGNKCLMINSLDAWSDQGNWIQWRYEGIIDDAGRIMVVDSGNYGGNMYFCTAPQGNPAAAAQRRVKILHNGHVIVSPLGTFTDNGAALQVVGSATVSGNLGIGGATNFGTGTNMLAIANGTVTGMAAISGQGEIFCESGELKAMDGSGNITTFSPHEELDNLVTNLADPLPHTYVSTNAYLGKKKIVNMAVLIEEIEKLSGKTLTTYEDVPLRDWTTDQDNFRVQRDLERLKIESVIDDLNTQIADIDNQLISSGVEEKKKEELKKSRESLQGLKKQSNKAMPDEYILQHPPKWMQERGVTLKYD